MASEPITDFQQVHDLPHGTVVQDSAGQVWVIKKPNSWPDETWLCPFSDEYAFWVKSNDSVNIGDTPALPLINTGFTSEPAG